MNMQLVGLRCMVVLVLCMASCFTYAQKALTLHVNRAAHAFEVVLPANATTGYQWTVMHVDTSRFKQISKTYIVPKSKLIGAGGQMVFSFQLRKGKSYPKQTELSFSYAQPWNPPSATSTKVTVIFD